MLKFLTMILACQLLGETVVGALALPVPGPVVGMLVLFLFLLIKGEVPAGLDQTATGLLGAMSLLFVPAGTGCDPAFQTFGRGACAVERRTCAQHIRHHHRDRSSDAPAVKGQSQMNSLEETWVYLSASPLFHLTLTLVAFQAASWLFEKSGHNPLLNPVLVAVLLIVPILLVTETDYATYFEGAQFVHFLLGPATVALAIPLYRQWHHVRRSARAILISLLSGSVTAIVTAVATLWAFGAPRDLMISVAPKSTTAPVAMALAEELGGLPSLTAVLVIVTGILGAMFGPLVLNLIGVKNWEARGLAIGTASHGIGTAQALQVNETAGAFSGLAMGLNALATALLLPLIWAVITQILPS